MNYSETEFYDLMERAEDQGGEHLDKMCKGRTFYMTGDEKQQKPLILGYCGNSTLFNVPYEALDVRGQEVGTISVEVCAVDDDMGRWPRFGGDRFGKDEA